MACDCWVATFASLTHWQHHFKLLQEGRVSQSIQPATVTANVWLLPRTGEVSKLDVVVASQTKLNKHLAMQFTPLSCQWRTTCVLHLLQEDCQLLLLHRCQNFIGVDSPRLAALAALHCRTQLLADCHPGRNLTALLIRLPLQRGTMQLFSVAAFQLRKRQKVTWVGWVWLWVRQPIDALEVGAGFLANASLTWNLTALPDLE